MQATEQFNIVIEGRGLRGAEKERYESIVYGMVRGLSATSVEHTQRRAAVECVVPRPGLLENLRGRALARVEASPFVTYRKL